MRSKYGHIRLFKNNGFRKRVLTAALIALLFPFNLIIVLLKSPFRKRGVADWEKERHDILKRGDCILFKGGWLYGDKTCSTVQTLLDAMPAMLGKHYGNEWAIYTCFHMAAALANIIRLYDNDVECLEKIEQMVETVLSPRMREYDTHNWGEDALKTLSGDNSHMTYLSILSWVISLYKMSGGGHLYDKTFDGCCEALNRRLLASPILNLPSLLGGIIFFPDMLFAIAALKNYADLNNGKYGDSVRMWIDRAKREWIDKKTGLMYSMLIPDMRRPGQYRAVGPRGSYAALNCYCLSMVDPGFAKQQYDRMKAILGRKGIFSGIREYPDRSPLFKLDPDAGPIALGLSPSGTAWAIGCATFFEDWDFRRLLLRTGEIAGITVNGKHRTRHYLLGELALVGEAVTLAMKTHCDRRYHVHVSY